MSYADNREQGLGIAPVVAAAVPLATKLLGAIVSLFKKKPKPPSPEDLARAQAYFDFRVANWASAFEKGNADTAQQNLDIIKRAGAVPGTQPSQLYKEYADAAMQVINEYLATNPSRTVTTSSGVTTKIAADATQNKLVQTADKSGYDRIDVATGEKIGTGTTVGSGSVVKAGVLGGMPALVIFGGLASLLFVAFQTDKRR